MEETAEVEEPVEAEGAAAAEVEAEGTAAAEVEAEADEPAVETAEGAEVEGTAEGSFTTTTRRGCKNK